MGTVLGGAGGSGTQWPDIRGHADCQKDPSRIPLPSCQGPRGSHLSRKLLQGFFSLISSRPHSRGPAINTIRGLLFIFIISEIVSFW